MVRLVSVFVIALGSIASAAPIMRRAFQLQDYAAFQISDGVAGNAAAEANAVFVTPFSGVDLASVDSTTLKAVQTMREAAEAAETDQFNPAIEAATGATATALQNGKIKNKVLKLTGEVQALQIQLAQAKAAGKSTSSIQSNIAAEQKKLDTNIAIDTKNAGQASKGVTSSSSAASTAETANEDVSATPAASSGTFTLKDYAAFQISDGKTGTAKAEAEAVFVTPFAGVDLATVDAATLDAVQTMREAAEAAETDQFNPAIAAASGASATALQNGKIKNKVLKLTGEVQALQIQLAQAQAAGKSTSSIASKIAAEQKKLDSNIAIDTKNAGQASKGVA
ncbi:uncharacterized protein BXZ73DRAFT_100938 [Epithele typhae]|uniref:uncharacterized protein n=1 Tax=Epithele typhae TaxID=378194 RepID=UPI0020077321|nr:uncharacterized protein BXZ73DRAFT_100938 [Epithele typhae]KAH9933553.1 hypothetical protein BXZ73DRAFT_100938 [Epithele typhae]